jgi:hypothetical protein
MTASSRTPYRSEIVHAAMLMTGIMVGVLCLAEAVGRGKPDAEWTAHLAEVDQALAARDRPAATRALNRAHLAALAAGGWEPLVEIGHASLRVGEAAHLRDLGVPKARQAWLTALFRARSVGSVEGALRASEGFAAVGDHQAAAAGLRIAASLAAGTPGTEAQARVQALRDRLIGRAPGPGEPGAE